MGGGRYAFLGWAVRHTRYYGRKVWGNYYDLFIIGRTTAFAVTHTTLTIVVCAAVQVDMLVGDIYGGRDYSSVGLSASTIACSFGKVVGQDKELADYNQAGGCICV